VLLNAPLPKEVAVDGIDISPHLFHRESLPERPFFYYRGEHLYACRLGLWKLHFKTQAGYGQPMPDLHDPPLLFQLGLDPGEKRNVAEKHADVLMQIQAAVKTHEAGVVKGEPQFD
jgi:hypothetical protein